MNAKKMNFVLATLVIATLLLTACQPSMSPTMAPPLVTSGKPYSNNPPTYAAAPTRAAESNRPQPTQAAAPIQGSGMPQPKPAIGNTFQDAGVNPFIDTWRDHLSTFAIDVDTAAYTVTRRYLNDGNLPPFDAVRVEEFVNFFDQGYRSPDNAGFAIYADGAPSPFHNDGSILMRVGVQGYRIPDSQRQSASLTFVIDVSGSMNLENRLGLVKRSLELLVNRLRSDDRVSIVVFGSTARIVLPSTRGNDRNTILNAIYSLNTEGSTNAEAGLRLGYEMAVKQFQPGINRVILCSDGVANTGLTNADDILRKIEGYVSEGIQLNTYGFGMGNFNDALLEKLADKGDGAYAYMDTLDEARRVFVERLTSTLEMIGKDVKVQVDFNPDTVTRYRLLGYENRAVADQDFRNDAVDAGEIGPGHTVTAVYAVQLAPNAQGRLATIQLRWQEPKTGRVQEISGNFNTSNLVSDFNRADPHYQLTAVVAEFAEILRESPFAPAGSGALYQLRDMAAGLSDRLPEDTDVRELIGLIDRAAQFTGRSRRN